MSEPTREEYMKAIADEIHKPIRKVKNRRRVRVSAKDETWSMDLVDMSEWKKDNDGEKYMLTVVDVFSRFAFARPMLTKSANDTFAAFIDIVDSSGRRPQKIWVDQGTEFYNSTFKKWMKVNGKTAMVEGKPVTTPVVMYSTFGESKSVIVERFNKTLKTKMWHYFTEANTRRWVDELPRLISWYNKRVHSTLGMSPWEASKVKNKEKVYKIHNPVHSESSESGIKRKAHYSIGDVVRISRIKGIFEKGYLPNFSREVFTVVEVQVPFSLDEPITYKLRDRFGEVLQGSFYDAELGPVKYPDVLLVEKVLKEKKVGGEKHLLVKWLGYSEKMNTWIPESSVLDFLDKPKFAVKSASDTKITLKRI